MVSYIGSISCCGVALFVLWVCSPFWTIFTKSNNRFIRVDTKSCLESSFNTEYFEKKNTEFDNYVRGIWKSSNVSYPYPTWPNSVLSNGAIVSPDAKIWDPVLKKIRCNQPLRVVALGGSITEGGGVTPTIEDRFRFVYAELIFQYFKTVFPNPDHEFFRYGYSGCGGAFFGACLSAFVPQETDIVILEFSLDDMEMPRVVSTNFYSMILELRSITKMIISINWLQALDIERLVLGKFPRSRTGVNVAIYGDVLGLIKMPVLFVGPVMQSIKFDNPKEYKWKYYSDHMHPNEVGHLMITNIFIAYLRCTAFSRLAFPDADIPVDPTFDPVNNTLIPMEPAWKQGTDPICLFGSKLRDNSKVKSGWKWVNEAKPGRAPREGYISYKAGETLELGPYEVSKYRTVTIGYLMSYGDYGSFEIETEEKCHARRLNEYFPFPVVNTRHDQKNSVVTTTYFVLDNKYLNQSELYCTIRLKNVPDNVTGVAKKVKISSFSLLPRGSIRIHTGHMGEHSPIRPNKWMMARSYKFWHNYHYRNKSVCNALF